MDQTHIGYTYWQQPPFQKMPELKYVPADSVTAEDVMIGARVETAANLVPNDSKGNIFYEAGGVVSIEAAHYSKAISSNGILWKILPDLGKTGDAVTTFPVTAADQKISVGSPQLQYEFYTYSKGTVNLNTYFSPSLNFHNTATGLQYGISIDDEQPQVIGINKDDNNVHTWEGWVANSIIIKTSSHSIDKPGKHILKYWMLSNDVVLQKLVIDLGGMKPSYLGPPESKR